MYSFFPPHYAAKRAARFSTSQLFREKWMTARAIPCQKILPEETPCQEPFGELDDEVPPCLTKRLLKSRRQASVSAAVTFCLIAPPLHAIVASRRWHSPYNRRKADDAYTKHRIKVGV
jgi:hypothetical protein